MIRPFRAETERYGHYSVAGESVWDHPFLWGSKRTGPDLARVGGRYSDDWQRAHLYNPRNVVPESKMPAYPFLVENKLDGKDTAKKMEVLRTLGVPLHRRRHRRCQRRREGQDRNGRAGGLPAGPGHHHQKQTVIFMDIGMIRGLGTVVVMVAFVGLALWVFSPKRKSEFDDATMLPFADDPEAIKHVEQASRSNKE